MEVESASNGAGAGPALGSGPGLGPTTNGVQKRNRVLLSCGPCRASKLKCDRLQPCTQCVKKSRAEGCQYAPKPEKRRPAKGMAARLKRLEGMVRNMMEGGADEVPGRPPPSGAADLGVPGQATAAAIEARSPAKEEGVEMAGQVVSHGERTTTTYVGATHFMAILEDIEDLKGYFEYPDEPEDGSPEAVDEMDSPEGFMFSQSSPRSRDDLLAMLPERKTMDRLIMRYFSSNSPSVHVVHRPTFQKQYAQFWQDPSKVHLHWLALLFMICGLGVFFSSFMAPHELQGDSSGSPMDRFKQFRAAAGWALIQGRYNQPTPQTLPPLILYVEAEFLVNRSSQMNCYLLSSVCIRLMMKMGLHRDPSKLAHLTPFVGEMRRRMWNLAIQIDLIVSFHMGLPSMIHGIESDTVLPRNLVDEDLDEKCLELPPARPPSDYTTMTYPINKATICRVFGQVARQAHSLTPPAYSEVMRLDRLLEEAWAKVPTFMKPRPLDECVTDPPMQVIQRFGLASLYNKSRCVLHRRYLADPVPRREHDYSRRVGLEAALNLLEFQHTIWQACQPGHLLSANGWFVSSLAVHDFLLAAMILYLVIRSEHYSEVGDDFDWLTQKTPTPTKDELRQMLRRSYTVWSNVSVEMPEVRKTAEILATMLGKVGSPVSTERSPSALNSADPTPQSEMSAATTRVDAGAGPLAALSISDQTPAYTIPSALPDPLVDNFEPMDLGCQGLETPMAGSFDPSWVTVGDELDWRYFDITMSQRSNQGIDIEQAFLDRSRMGEADFMSPGLWDRNTGQGT